MNFSSFFRISLFLFALGFCPTANAGQSSLLFAADDQTSIYLPNGMQIVPRAGVGAVTALDLAVFPPRIFHLEGIPCSVIGPPTCIAATRDGGIILVAGAMQSDPTHPDRLIPDNRVTRLSWRGRGLKKESQIPVGIQPSGIALTQDGKRAFVTLRGEGAVAVLALGDSLSLQRKIIVADASASISHITLSPDEHTALTTLHENNAVLFFSVDPNGSFTSQEKISVGNGPYSAVFVDDFHALVACTNDGTVYSLEKHDGRWSVAGRTSVGRNPEGLALSADRKRVAVSCFDGILVADPKNPWYGQPSRVYLFEVDPNGRLNHPQTVDAENMVQSAVFTSDSRYLVIGQYGQGNLSFFKREAGRWIDTGLRLKTPGQVAALAVAGH